MMNRSLIRSILAAGLLGLSGNALAVKGSKAIDPTSTTDSTLGTVEMTDVEAAAREVCRVWNTEEMGPTLHPDFPDKQSFLNAFGTLPKDARLVFVSLGQVQTNAQEVVAKVQVYIEYKQGASTHRDATREVTWTFKR